MPKSKLNSCVWSGATGEAPLDGKTLRWRDGFRYSYFKSGEIPADSRL